MTGTRGNTGQTRSLLGGLLMTLLLPLHALADDLGSTVEKTLREHFSQPAFGLVVRSVQPSAIDGIYEVTLDSGPLLYASPDGEFFIVGDMYNAAPDGLVNLSEERRSQQRLEALAAIEIEDQIVFPAEGETLAHITVFTDVSCVYCQRLHREVPELNRRGVEVRYMAYPRQGLGSDGFRQLATAWCADDRQTTLTRMKNREQISDNVCAGNPIAQQYALGQEVGVRGTPAIILPGGEMIPGYRPVDVLLTDLGIE